MADEQVNGFVELRHGMNGERSPVLLADTQYAKGLNVIVRGGLVKTRPALVAESVTGMPTGVTVQGVGRWSLQSGDRLVFVAAGKVYTLRVDTMILTDLGLQMDTTAQCFFTQVDRYLVVQDGTSSAFVINEVAGVDQAYTDPIGLTSGYMGVFAQGRYHFVPRIVPSTAVSGRPYIVSADILEPLDPTSVLDMDETEYLASGGAHSQPTELGYIGGLGIIRNARTGTGVGQVIALSRYGVCAYDFSAARAQWTSRALSQVLYFGGGSQSPWSVLNVNNDLLYRSSDGIRILTYTASQVAGSSGSLSNMPVSIEVNTFLESDEAYLPYVSMAEVDNRVYCTAGGTNSKYFQGLISWDVAAPFYSGVEGLGAYDGMWTGDNFSQVISALVSGKPTGFVFADGPVLYRIDPDIKQDNSTTSIESRVETKTYNFGDRTTAKQLVFTELWMSGLEHDVELKIWYRPHGWPLWKSLGTRNIQVASGSLPQIRRRIRFSLDDLDNNCDSNTGDPLYTATEFQFAVQWTGYAVVEAFRAVARVIREEPPDPCDESEGVAIVASTATGEALSDYSYTI